MVLLLLTPTLRTSLEAITSALPVELALQLTAALERDDAASPPLNEPEDVPKRLKLEVGTISHEILVRISQWARKDGGDKRSQSGPATPVAVLGSPELLAILSSIQLANDRAEYAAMTAVDRPVFTSSLPMRDQYDPAMRGGSAKTIAEEWKEIQREVAAILNVGASMAAVGTAVWWVGGGRSYAARLSLAMAGALAIAAIEAFLYYRFFTRHSSAKSDGKKKAAATKLKVLAFDSRIKLE
ncbi:ATPase, vacuolar ER assembly factor, Vma12 [Pseudohyphozyma bogoriensis]|nr:ATPase, vacuolar ER assembly factor, Vma12 [Pseudohyphozyma bogoriensis]